MELVDTSMFGIRSLTHGLRPALLDDLGLLPALRSLIAEFESQHDRQVTFTAPESIPVVSEESEVVIYRAVQEGLSNFARHTTEWHVAVDLRPISDQLRLEISDEGPGFDDGRAGLGDGGRLGLDGMRERALAVGGTFEVHSGPSRGVRLRVSVPVESGITS